MRLGIAYPVAVLAALALAVPAVADSSTQCTGSDAIPTATNLPAIRATTLCLLNVQRAEHGLHALTINASLQHSSSAYSALMVHHTFFAHVSPGGSTLYSRVKKTSYLTGVQSWALGENIAWANGDLASPEQIVTAWMHSAGHRANILNPIYRDIGVGVYLGAPMAVSGGGDPGATYTTDFGERTH